MNAVRDQLGKSKKYSEVLKTPFEVALSQMSNEDLLPAVIDRNKETVCTSNRAVAKRSSRGEHFVLAIHGDLQQTRWRWSIGSGSRWRTSPDYKLRN